MPALMLEDLLDAFFVEQMVVPTSKLAWEELRADIAACASLMFTPTYLDHQIQRMNPLDLPVSLLVRDMQAREYDFFVTLDSSGGPSSHAATCIAPGETVFMHLLRLNSL
jgi:hypothetical protein